MKNIYNISRMFLCGVVALMATACTDTWEGHYTVNESLNSDMTLWEIIETDTTLNGFAKLLKKAGYDTVLTMNRFYTVWAPKGDVLDFDTDDLEKLEKEFIQNHIANFGHGASNVLSAENSVKMLNGKRLPFARQGGSLKFNNVVVDSENIQAKNGVLHRIGGNGEYSEFKPNVWEYLATVDTLSLFNAYMMAEMDSTIDYSRSIELGRNDAGEMVYADTVWSYSNPWWNKIGQLNNEDSAYILIAPSNAAWRAKYDEVSSYLQFAAGAEVENPDSLRDLYAKEFMCRHLVFSKTVQKAAGKDSLISNYQVYYEPLVFSGSDKDTLFHHQIGQEVEVSNGTIHIVDKLNYSPIKCFLDTIRIEGENGTYCKGYGTTGTGVECEIVSIDKDALYIDSITDPLKKDTTHVYDEVSNGKYMRVATDKASRGMSVNYTVPGVFSGKYRVKLVLLPEIYDGDVAKPSNKHANVSLKIAPNGKEEVEAKFKGKINDSDVSDLNFQGMTTLVLVNPKTGEDFITIPNCEYQLKDPKTQITITSERLPLGKGTPDMMTLRIDCIILEPVIE